MTDKKTVFMAFAIEDERQRDLLKGQTLHPREPFKFIDMSVKKPNDTKRGRCSPRGEVDVSEQRRPLRALTTESRSTTKLLATTAVVGQALGPFPPEADDETIA